MSGPGVVSLTRSDPDNHPLLYDTFKGAGLERLNGHFAFLLPSDPGAAPPPEDLASFINDFRVESLPPIMGMKGNHLGFDHDAIVATSSRQPLVEHALNQLVPPGTQQAEGHEFFAVAYVGSEQHCQGWHVHGVGGSVCSSGGGGHPGHVRDVVREQHQGHIGFRIGQARFLIRIGGAGAPLACIVLPHRSYWLLDRPGSGELELVPAPAHDPQQPSAERRVHHAVPALAGADSEFLVTLMTKITMPGATAQDAIRAAAYAVEAGELANADAHHPPRAMPFNLCVAAATASFPEVGEETEAAWDAYDGPTVDFVDDPPAAAVEAADEDLATGMVEGAVACAGSEVEKLRAGLNQTKALSFLSSISQARLLSQLQSHALMREFGDISAWLISHPKVRKWLVRHYLAYSDEEHPKRVRAVLTESQIEALRAACSRDALVAAIAAAQKTLEDAKLEPPERVKAQQMFGDSLVRYVHGAMASGRLLEAAAGVGGAAAEVDAVLPSFRNAASRDIVVALRRREAWPAYHLEQAEELWSRLRSAVRAGVADAAFMAGWEPQRLKLHNLVAEALLPEQREALKELWTLLSLVHARAAHASTRHRGVFDNGEVRELTGPQLRALKLVAAGRGIHHPDPAVSRRGEGAKQRTTHGWDAPASKEAIEAYTREAGPDALPVPEGTTGKQLGYVKMAKKFAEQAEKRGGVTKGHELVAEDDAPNTLSASPLPAEVFQAVKDEIHRVYHESGQTKLPFVRQLVDMLKTQFGNDFSRRLKHQEWYTVRTRACTALGLRRTLETRAPPGQRKETQKQKKAAQRTRAPKLVSSTPLGRVVPRVQASLQPAQSERRPVETQQQQQEQAPARQQQQPQQASRAPAVLSQKRPRAEQAPAEELGQQTHEAGAEAD